MAVTPGFFLLLALMVLFNSTEYMLIIFLSALLHELAHFGVMRYYKIPTGKITFQINGISILPKRQMSYREEIAVCLAGPIVNISVFLAVCLLKQILKNIPSIISQIGMCNCILGLFNLCPFPPFDGGRAIRCLILQRKGNKNVK